MNKHPLYRRIRDSIHELRYGFKLFFQGYWDLSDGTGKCWDHNWKKRDPTVLKSSLYRAYMFLTGGWKKL